MSESSEQVVFVQTDKKKIVNKNSILEFFYNHFIPFAQSVSLLTGVICLQSILLGLKKYLYILCLGIDDINTWRDPLSESDDESSIECNITFVDDTLKQLQTESGFKKKIEGRTLEAEIFKIYNMYKKLIECIEIKIKFIIERCIKDKSPEEYEQISAYKNLILRAFQTFDFNSIIENCVEFDKLIHETNPGYIVRIDRIGQIRTQLLDKQNKILILPLKKDTLISYFNKKFSILFRFSGPISKRYNEPLKDLFYHLRTVISKNYPYHKVIQLYKILASQFVEMIDTFLQFFISEEHKKYKVIFHNMFKSGFKNYDYNAIDAGCCMIFHCIPLIASYQYKY